MKKWFVVTLLIGTSLFTSYLFDALFIGFVFSFLVFLGSLRVLLHGETDMKVDKARWEYQEEALKKGKDQKRHV